MLATGRALFYIPKSRDHSDHGKALGRSTLARAKPTMSQLTIGESIFIILPLVLVLMALWRIAEHLKAIRTILEDIAKATSDTANAMTSSARSPPSRGMGEWVGSLRKNGDASGERREEAVGYCNRLVRQTRGSA
jgi:hypothetical protein